MVVVPPAAVDVEGFTEEAEATTAAAAAEEEDEACVEDDGDVLFVAPPCGTVSDEQFCEPSTRGASSVFEEDVPAAASHDSPFTVRLSLSGGWCVGVFLREASPLTACPRTDVCPRAGLQELEGAPLSTLLEVEQEPDLRPRSVPFITLFTALEEDDSPFS